MRKGHTRTVDDPALRKAQTRLASQQQHAQLQGFGFLGVSQGAGITETALPHLGSGAVAGIEAQKAGSGYLKIHPEGVTSVKAAASEASVGGASNGSDADEESFEDLELISDLRDANNPLQAHVTSSTAGSSYGRGGSFADLSPYRNQLSYNAKGHYFKSGSSNKEPSRLPLGSIRGKLHQRHHAQPVTSSVPSQVHTSSPASGSASAASLSTSQLTGAGEDVISLVVQAQSTKAVHSTSSHFHSQTLGVDPHRGYQQHLKEGAMA